jgi:hypothetical protein
MMSFYLLVVYNFGLMFRSQYYTFINIAKWKHGLDSVPSEINKGKIKKKDRVFSQSCLNYIERRNFCTYYLVASFFSNYIINKIMFFNK